MSLEVEGVVTLEGPGQTVVTIRGEGRDLVVSVPNAGQARRLLGLPEIRRLLKMSPVVLDHLVRAKLHLKLEVGRKTVLTSRLFDRFKR